MNDGGTINLKNLKRPAPAPVASPMVHAPTAATAIPPQPLSDLMPSYSAPMPVVRPPAPPASARTAPVLPPKPRRGFGFSLPSFGFKTGAIIAGVFVVIGVLGYLGYNFIWIKSPFGPTPGAPSAETLGQDVETSSASSASAAAASESAGDASSLTADQIVARVSKIILVPQDETPTLAGVSDPHALSDQEFFKNATIGDVVLMYAKAQRAILYDPKQNKIIEVGPITNASSTSAQ